MLCNLAKSVYGRLEKKMKKWEKHTKMQGICEAWQQAKSSGRTQVVRPPKGGREWIGIQKPTSAPPSTGRHTPVTYLAASEHR